MELSKEVMMESTISYELRSALWLAAKDSIEFTNQSHKLDQGELLKRAVIALAAKVELLQEKLEGQSEALTELKEVRQELADARAYNRELEEQATDLESEKESLKWYKDEWNKACEKIDELKIQIESLTGNE